MCLASNSAVTDWTAQIAVLSETVLVDIYIYISNPFTVVFCKNWWCWLLICVSLVQMCVYITVCIYRVACCALLNAYNFHTRNMSVCILQINDSYIVKLLHFMLLRFAWEDCCVEYWCEKTRECMSRWTGRRDMTEKLLKTALNPNQSMLLRYCIVQIILCL